MSTVVIGGGGPRPQARIVGFVEQGEIAPSGWAIVDGKDVLAIFSAREQAEQMLPTVIRGA